MNDTKNPPPGNGPARSDLDVWLSELERRLGRLEDRRTTPGDRLTEVEAELGVLRQAVEDLAAGNLDLNNQLIKLVSSCERILAGAGVDDLEVQRRGGLRRSASAVGRATRRMVRGTIGAARRMAGGREVETDESGDVDVRLATSPAATAPRIAVVVRVLDDPETLDVPAVLRSQTDPGLTVILWNRSESKAAVHVAGADPMLIDAAHRAAVAAAFDADLVADLELPLPHLHPATLELCRWTAASEGLPLVVAGDSGGSLRRGWRLESVDDWAASGAKNGAPVRPRMVKMVGGWGWGPPEALSSPSAAAGFGRAYLPRPEAKGSLVHKVSPLNGVVAPAAAGDDRPAVLILLSASGGELGAWLLRVLGEDYRCIVFLAGNNGGSSLLRGLTELAERVYPVDRFLEPVVWPSLVADVVRAHEVRSVLRVGASFDMPVFEDSRAVVVDLPIDRSEIVAGADALLALGRGIAEAANETGVVTRALVPGPAPGGEIPGNDRSAGVRAAYGVPEDARLVLTMCDLEPTNRPADVAAIARRLRHREDIHMMLIGQGALAGSISDLAGYFELDRFVFAPPGHPVAELVAACDCVLSTAEVDPWPVSIGAALALGRSVVATEIDGVRELVAAANGDRCTLLPPGDVNGLAAAVVEALETQRKPRVTKKAWKAARARSANAADEIRDALGGGSVGEQENL